jgi:hypothetical protein
MARDQANVARQRVPATVPSYTKIAEKATLGSQQPMAIGTSAGAPAREAPETAGRPAMKAGAARCLGCWGYHRSGDAPCRAVLLVRPACPGGRRHS